MDGPLVGRDELLERVLAQLRRGRGAILSGGLGVGKTAVVESLSRTFAQERWLVRTAIATAAATDLPFGAVSHLLPNTVTGDALRTFERARQRLVIEAGGRSVLVVVDDAHHLDDLSASLVHRLAVTHAATVLATVRSSEEPGETLTSLWKDGHLDRVVLRPLERRGHDRMVAGLLDGPPAVDLLDACWRQTEGNPLFVRELVLAAVDAGDVLQREDGVWHMARALAPTDRLIEIVRSRLGRLRDDVRTALEVVAVTEPLPRAVATRLATGPGIDELESRGLVRVRRVDDVDLLSCSHPMYGEVVRAAITSQRRSEIQGRFASVIGASRRVHIEDELRAAAWLLESEHELEPGLAERAAETALSRSDPVLAERLAGAALVAGPRFRALWARGTALSLTGRADEAEAVLREAADFAEDDAGRVSIAVARAHNAVWMLRDLRLAGTLLSDAMQHVQDPSAEAELKAEQAIIAAVSGDAAATVALADEVLAEDLAGDGATLTALIQSTLARCILGRFDRLDADLDRGDRIAEKLADEHPLADLQLGITRVMYVTYVDLAEARRMVDRGYAEAMRSGRGPGLWSVVGAEIRLERGESEQARHVASRGVVELASFDPFHNRPMGQAVMALANAMCGDPAAATTALDGCGDPEGLEPRTRYWYDRALAWRAASEGDFAEAVRLAEGTARRAEQASLLTWAASAYFDAIRLGEPAGVVDGLQDLAGTTSAPLVATLATAAEAAAEGSADELQGAAAQLLRRGAMVPAADLLAQAAARLSADDPTAMNRLRFRAERLRSNHGASRAPTPHADPSGLSPRQRDVLERALGGASSREIAEELFLSRRTVDNHLSRIYRHLGVGGREELVALATGDVE